MTTPEQDQAITPAGLEALEAELAELEGPVRVALAKKIKAAREEGDLSENAEYHALKDEQAHLETKIARLRGRRQTAVVVEPDDGAGVVAFGGDGARDRPRRPGASRRSRSSARPRPTSRAGACPPSRRVARALLGAAPGDEVDVETPRGRAALARRRRSGG